MRKKMQSVLNVNRNFLNNNKLHRTPLSKKNNNNNKIKNHQKLLLELHKMQPSFSIYITAFWVILEFE